MSTLHWIHLILGMILLLKRDETEQEFPGLRQVGFFFTFSRLTFLKENKPGRAKAFEFFAIPSNLNENGVCCFNSWAVIQKHPTIHCQAGWKQFQGKIPGSYFSGPTELVPQSEGTAQALFNLCPLHYSSFLSAHWAHGAGSWGVVWSYSPAEWNHKAPIKNWLFCSRQACDLRTALCSGENVTAGGARWWHCSSHTEVEGLLGKAQRMGDAHLPQKQNWGAPTVSMLWKKIPFQTIPRGRAGEKRLHFISNTLRNELPPASSNSKISYSTEELNSILFFLNAVCSFNR